MSSDTNDIDFAELFRRAARPGEIFNDEWIDTVRALIPEEGTLLDSESYEDDFPATEDTEIYLFRGLYIVLADPFDGGPFATLDEAREFAEIGVTDED